MGAQEFMNGIVRVLQVRELPRARGAHLAARGGQSLGDAVIAERAFLRRVGLGIDEAASVGAGLHAVAAAQAVILVHQDDSIGTDECGAHRADLRARGIGAMVAELGNEKVLAALVLARRESLLPAIGRFDLGALDPVVGDVVALDPGPVVAVGNIVFLRAGADAIAAADAFRDVNQHAPPVFGNFVVGGGFRSSSLNEFPGHGGGGEEYEEAAASDVHYLFAPAADLACSSILGRCG